MKTSLHSGERASASAYRPDIDGLRAVAVLLVIFFHAGLGAVSGGFVGVDVFFVISGYLITGIVARELDEGTFTFANFYARRIKRICPALFAVLAVSSIAALFILIPDELRFYGRSLMSAVLFYANWLFYTKVNYFDGPSIEKPLLHTWSLAVEEQYYLLWPLALAGLYRIGRREALPYIVLALLCLSLAASQIVLELDPAQVFYLLPYRGWELLLGGYLAIAPFRPLSGLAASVIGLAGIAAIAYAGFFFDTKTAFPGLNALIPCLGAAMVIAGGLHERSWSRAVLGLKPFRAVGKISYSLYLIHWPVFSFAHIALDREPSAGEAWAMIALSVMLASLSYRFVETPARQSPGSFARLGRLAVGPAVALALCGGLYDAAWGLPWRAPKGVQAAYAAKFPGYRESDLADCLREPKPGSVHRPCPIGAPAKDLQYDFVIWGDSHARHFARGFSDQAKARGLAGLVTWEVRCPPVLDGDRDTKHACAEANRLAWEWIATQTKLKTVFLAATWKHHMPETASEAGKLDATAEGNAPSYPALDRTISMLLSRGLAVAVVETVPAFPVNVPDCAARARMFGRPDEQCFSVSRDRMERAAAPATAMLKEVSGHFGIPVVETHRAFCDGGACRPEKDGQIFYTDATHLNSAGSRYLGSRIDIPWPAPEPRGSMPAASN